MIAERAFIPSVSTLRRHGILIASPAVGRSRSFSKSIPAWDDGRVRERGSRRFHEVHALSSVEVHSVSTHLTVSDQDEEFTRGQLDHFARLIRQLRAEIPVITKRMCFKLRVCSAFAEEPFEIVRPGMLIYGISSLPEFQSALHPVMRWKARIALIRDMPAGHGISYGRTFITPKKCVWPLFLWLRRWIPASPSNRGTRIGSRSTLPAPGRVTMDLMMIDVFVPLAAAVGDEVVLMGRQGDEEVSCTELADRAHTITWEITTRIDMARAAGLCVER